MGVRAHEVASAPGPAPAPGSAGCGCGGVGCSAGGESTPVASGSPASSGSEGPEAASDLSSLVWLDKRFRLFQSLHRGGRRLLWERVRVSGPERRVRLQVGSGGLVEGRRWDSERSSGTPLVNFTDEEGPSPFDPERPFALAGWRLERQAGSRPAPGGGTEFFQAIWAVPDRGPPHAGRLTDPDESLVPVLGDGLAFDGQVKRVAIRLRDRERLPPLPSRSPGALAWEEGGRSSPRAGQRRAVIEQIRTRREAWIAEVVAEIRASGGDVHGWTVVVGPVVRATVGCDLLRRLAIHPQVVRIERDSNAPPVGESARPWSEGCTGPAPAWLSEVDANTCAPLSDGTNAEYLDSVNLATGAKDYLDRGYNGGNVSGGLAEWGQVGAWRSDGTGAHAVGTVSTLGLVVLDWQFWARHPAFRDFLGGDRVRAYLDSGGDAHSDVRYVLARDTWGHGTRVAGIAMGDVTGGQDPSLPDAAAWGARSGLAGGVAGVFSDTQTVLDTAEIILGGGLWSTERGRPVEGAGGADVLTTSLTFNTTGIEAGCGKMECQTELQLRGLDYDSLVVNLLYREGTLTFKSAGNTGECSSEFLTNCGYQWQLGHPSAAAASITVGAGDTNAVHPSWYLGPPVAVQRNEEVWEGSAGLTTADGRTHPLMTAWSGVCGAPTPRHYTLIGDFHGTDVPADVFTYGDMGATSAAAPRAAGAAILFKHWALETQGSVANTPGWLAVNVLHFANGVAWSSVYATGSRVVTPAPSFGLGKLRMRLYEAPREGARWGYQTWETSAYTGSVTLLDLGVLPDDVQRVRITAWWLEVNTGLAERKAHLALHLVSHDGGGFWGGTTTAETSTDRVLRIDLDCTDEAFGAPTGGATSLILQGIDVPTEERDARRAYRDVYVAVFWETGPDSSILACDAPRLCRGVQDVLERPSDRAKVRLQSGDPRLAAWKALRESIEGQLSALAGATRGPMSRAVMPAVGVHAAS